MPIGDSNINPDIWREELGMNYISLYILSIGVNLYAETSESSILYVIIL